MTFGGGADTETGLLPLTVEELVAEYRCTRQLNEELCAFIDNIRVECSNIAEVSPYAAEALHDLMSAAYQGNPAVASFLKANGPPRSGGGGVPEKGEKNNEMSRLTAGGTTKSRFLQFVEEATRDYKEECCVLRVKMMAMLGDQKLLMQARKTLREQEKKYGSCMSALSACRNELAVSRSQCSFLLGVLKDGESTATASTVRSVIQDVSECMLAENGECDGSTVAAGSTATDVDSLRSLAVRLVRAEVGLQESQAEVKSLEADVKKLSYGNDQLNARLGALAAERDTLKSHNAQLEGQLHRLLLSFHDDAETRWGVQGDGEVSAVVACGVRESPGRDELRERLQRLSCENRALQNTLLQLQRQINDSELRAEELYSDGGGDALVLKEEVSRLRDALREKQFELQRIHYNGEKATTQWGLLDKVHRTVIHHMSLRLMHDASRRFLPCPLGDTPSKAPTPASEDTKVAESSGTVSTDTAAVAAVAKDAKKGEAQAVAAVAAVPPFSNSGNDSRVKELVSLLESKDNEHRLALRQWQHVNQELRSALASSQKELKQKENRIKVLEQERRCCDAHATACSRVVVSDSHGDRSGDDSPKFQPTTLEQMNGVGQKDIHVEKETLLQQLADLQKENRSLSALLGESQARCALLEREHAKRVGTVSQSLEGCTVLTDAFSIRNLQRILHDVLQENMVLLAKVKELEAS